MSRFFLKLQHFRKRTLALLPLVFMIQTGCSGLKNSAQPTLYRMGERAEAGSLIYTVLEAEWHTQLGEGAQARIPQHRFLLIRLTATNSGASPSPVPRLTLIAPRGDSYQELTEGEQVPQWLGIVRILKPADTAEGRVLFDVPRGDYKLRVTDDALDPEQASVAMIEIPLRFETKAMPLPDTGR